MIARARCKVAAVRALLACLVLLAGCEAATRDLSDGDAGPQDRDAPDAGEDAGFDIPDSGPAVRVP